MSFPQYWGNPPVLGAPRLINEDKEVKSYRKFFFGYINKCLALMRTIESMNYASGSGKDKSSTHNNNTETKPDGVCLMEGCGKIHRSARGKKATQSLAFWYVFKAMNLMQRTALAKKHNACNLRLQPGRGIKTCKLESLKCRTCDGK